MDLSLLAAKQKRLLNWQKVLHEQAADPELQRKFFDALKAYRNTLARMWRARAVRPEDLTELFDLERELEQLDERARLRTAAP